MTKFFIFIYIFTLFLTSFAINNPKCPVDSSNTTIAGYVVDYFKNSQKDATNLLEYLVEDSVILSPRSKKAQRNASTSLGGEVCFTNNTSWRLKSSQPITYNIVVEDKFNFSNFKGQKYIITALCPLHEFIQAPQDIEIWNLLKDENFENNNEDDDDNYTNLVSALLTVIIVELCLFVLLFLIITIRRIKAENKETKNDEEEIKTTASNLKQQTTNQSFQTQFPYQLGEHENTSDKTSPQKTEDANNLHCNIDHAQSNPNKKNNILEVTEIVVESAGMYLPNNVISQHSTELCVAVVDNFETINSSYCDVKNHATKKSSLKIANDQQCDYMALQAVNNNVTADNYDQDSQSTQLVPGKTTNLLTQNVPVTEVCSMNLQLQESNDNKIESGSSVILKDTKADFIQTKSSYTKSCSKKKIGSISSFKPPIFPKPGKNVSRNSNSDLKTHKQINQDDVTLLSVLTPKPKGDFLSKKSKETMNVVFNQDNINESNVNKQKSLLDVVETTVEDSSLDLKESTVDESSMNVVDPTVEDYSIVVVETTVEDSSIVVVKKTIKDDERSKENQNTVKSAPSVIVATKHSLMHSNKVSKLVSSHENIINYQKQCVKEAASLVSGNNPPLKVIYNNSTRHSSIIEQTKQSLFNCTKNSKLVSSNEKLLSKRIQRDKETEMLTKSVNVRSRTASIMDTFQNNSDSTSSFVTKTSVCKEKFQNQSLINNQNAALLSPLKDNVIVKTTVKDSSVDVVETTVEDSSVDVVETTVEDSSLDVVETTVEDFSVDVVETTVEDSSVDVVETTVEDSSVDVAETTVKDSSVDVVETMVEESSVDVVETTVEESKVDVVETTVENASVDVVETTVEESSVDVVETTVEDSSVDVVETTVEESSVDVVETTVEDSSVDVVETRVEDSSVDVVETTVEDSSVELKENIIPQISKTKVDQSTSPETKSDATETGSLAVLDCVMSDSNLKEFQNNVKNPNFVIAAAKQSLLHTSEDSKLLSSHENLISYQKQHAKETEMLLNCVDVRSRAGIIREKFQSNLPKVPLKSNHLLKRVQERKYVQKKDELLKHHGEIVKINFKNKILENQTKHPMQLNNCEETLLNSSEVSKLKESNKNLLSYREQYDKEIELLTKSVNVRSRTATIMDKFQNNSDSTSSFVTKTSVCKEKFQNQSLVNNQNAALFSPLKDNVIVETTVKGSSVDVAETTVEDSSVDVAKTTVEDSSADVEETTVEDSNLDVAETTVEDSSVDVIETTVEDSSVDVAETTVEDSSVDVVETTVEESSVDVVETTVEDSSVNVVETTVEESSVDVVETTVEESSVDVVETTVEDSIVDVVETTVEDSSVDVAETTVEDSSVDVVETTVEESSVDVVETTAEDSSVDVAETTVEDSSLDVVETTVKDSSIDVVETTVEDSSVELKENIIPQISKTKVDQSTSPETKSDATETGSLAVLDCVMSDSNLKEFQNNVKNPNSVIAAAKQSLLHTSEDSKLLSSHENLISYQKQHAKETEMLLNCVDVRSRAGIIREKFQSNLPKVPLKSNHLLKRVQERKYVQKKDELLKHHGEIVKINFKNKILENQTKHPMQLNNCEETLLNSSEVSKLKESNKNLLCYREQYDKEIELLTKSVNVRSRTATIMDKFQNNSDNRSSFVTKTSVCKGKFLNQSLIRNQNAALLSKDNVYLKHLKSLSDVSENSLKPLNVKARHYSMKSFESNMSQTTTEVIPNTSRIINELAPTSCSENVNADAKLNIEHVQSIPNNKNNILTATELVVEPAGEKLPINEISEQGTELCAAAVENDVEEINPYFYDIQYHVTKKISLQPVNDQHCNRKASEAVNNEVNVVVPECDLVSQWKQLGTGKVTNCDKMLMENQTRNTIHLNGYKKNTVELTTENKSKITEEILTVSVKKSCSNTNGMREIKEASLPTRQSYQSFSSHLRIRPNDKATECTLLSKPPTLVSGNNVPSEFQNNIKKIPSVIVQIKQSLLDSSKIAFSHEKFTSYRDEHDKEADMLIKSVRLKTEIILDKFKCNLGNDSTERQSNSTFTERYIIGSSHSESTPLNSSSEISENNLKYSTKNTKTDGMKTVESEISITSSEMVLKKSIEAINFASNHHLKDSNCNVEEPEISSITSCFQPQSSFNKTEEIAEEKMLCENVLVIECFKTTKTVSNELLSTQKCLKEYCEENQLSVEKNDNMLECKYESSDEVNLKTNISINQSEVAMKNNSHEDKSGPCTTKVVSLPVQPVSLEMLSSEEKSSEVKDAKSYLPTSEKVIQSFPICLPFQSSNTTTTKTPIAKLAPQVLHQRSRQLTNSVQESPSFIEKTDPTFECLNNVSKLLSCYENIRYCGSERSMAKEMLTKTVDISSKIKTFEKQSEKQSVNDATLARHINALPSPCYQPAACAKDHKNPLNTGMISSAKAVINNLNVQPRFVMSSGRPTKFRNSVQAFSSAIEKANQTLLCSNNVSKLLTSYENVRCSGNERTTETELLTKSVDVRAKVAMFRNQTKSGFDKNSLKTSYSRDLDKKHCVVGSLKSHMESISSFQSSAYPMPQLTLSKVSKRYKPMKEDTPYAVDKYKAETAANQLIHAKFVLRSQQKNLNTPSPSLKDHQKIDKVFLETQENSRSEKTINEKKSFKNLKNDRINVHMEDELQEKSSPCKIKRMSFGNGPIVTLSKTRSCYQIEMASDFPFFQRKSGTGFETLKETRQSGRKPSSNENQSESERVSWRVSVSDTSLRKKTLKIAGNIFPSNL